MNYIRLELPMLFLFVCLFCSDISLCKMLTDEYTFLHADLPVLNNINE